MKSFEDIVVADTHLTPSQLRNTPTNNTNVLKDAGYVFRAAPRTPTTYWQHPSGYWLKKRG